MAVAMMGVTLPKVWCRPATDVGWYICVYRPANQIIAFCFHRVHVHTNKGGIQRS
jgi:hypothetical protein